MGQLGFFIGAQMYCNHSLMRLNQRFGICLKKDLDIIKKMVFDQNLYVMVYKKHDGEERRKIDYKGKTIIAVIKDGVIKTFIPDRDSRNYWIDKCENLEDVLKDKDEDIKELKIEIDTIRDSVEKYKRKYEQSEREKKILKIRIKSILMESLRRGEVIRYHENTSMFRIIMKRLSKFKESRKGE